MGSERRLTVTIKSAICSRTIRAIAAAAAATLAASAQAPEASVQQLVAMQRAWGPKTNSSGATLMLTEGSRSTAQGHALVRYRMMTSGLPKDKTYSLLLWQTGAQQPQGVMNGVTIDANGTAICAGKAGTCRGDKPDDPVDLAMQAGLGEVKRVALIAEDKSVHVFASVVPFPNRAIDAGCTVEETLVTPKAEAVMLSATGFKPEVALDIEMNSEGEIQHPSGKTDANGAYEWVVLPFKKGLTKGRAQVSVRSEGCKPSLSFAWGEGSYVLQ